VRDLARIVDVDSRTGWLVDEVEIRSNIPAALMSVCQTPPSNRRNAMDWLEDRIADDGGDVARQWRLRGRSLGAVKDLLLWTRTRMLFERAEKWAIAGRCPFWLEPSPQFRGVHVQGERYILTVEGGGRFSAEHAQGEVTYGGGGSGRLLAGRSFDSFWALFAGVEFGGEARFDELRIGDDQELPSLKAFAAFPLVLRWDFGLSMYAEIEAGPLVFIDSAVVRDETNPGSIDADSIFGAHTGIALGGSFLRLKQGVIPKIAFTLTVDSLPSEGITQIGFGARTGFDVSFWRRW